MRCLTLPVLLARYDLPVLQVGHQRQMLLVPLQERRTDDELLRKCGDIQQRRDTLRRDRGACWGERRESDGYTSGQEGPELTAPQAGGMTPGT